jgi:penicillin-binding protein 1A
MTAAFSVFPDGGEWVRPRYLEAIVDRNGAKLPLGQPDRRRAMSEAGAWILAGMLRDVNIRGTAADIWADGFKHASGGKTGTSNDYRDAWYIGFTKRYTVGIWVGTDDHASLGEGHTGTEDAMPIWADIMEGLQRGVKVKDFETDFPRPSGVSDVRICMLTGKSAQRFCDSTAQDFRVEGMGAALPPCRPELHGIRPGGTSPEAGKEKAKDQEEAKGRGKDKTKEKSGSLLDRLWKRIKL